MNDLVLIHFLEAENPEEGGMEVNEIKEKKKYTRSHRAKLLQFYDNRRPPYWGTWRKKSRAVRPRAPFNMDKVIVFN